MSSPDFLRTLIAQYGGDVYALDDLTKPGLSWDSKPVVDALASSLDGNAGGFSELRAGLGQVVGVAARHAIGRARRSARPRRCGAMGLRPEIDWDGEDRFARAIVI